MHKTASLLTASIRPRLILIILTDIKSKFSAFWFSYLLITPERTQLGMVIGVKHYFIQFLCYDRHLSTLTMMQGKLERGPEEVAP